MAKIGLRDPWYSVVTLGVNSSTQEEEETLGTAKCLAKAVKITATPNAPSVDLYADDGVDESVSRFIKGSGTLIVNDLDDAAMLDLFEISQPTSSDELYETEENTTRYIRLGVVVVKIKGGVTYYRGMVLARVKFNIPTDEWDTQGEQIVLATTELPFEFYRNVDRVWRKRSSWTQDYATAKAWMKAALAQTDLTVKVPAT